MQYVHWFVQHFNLIDERAFLAFERQFAELERRHTGVPEGPPATAAQRPRAPAHADLGMRDAFVGGGN